MTEPSEALRERARDLRLQADRLEQMAKELDSMPIMSSLPTKAKGPSQKAVGKKKGGPTTIDVALGLLKSAKQVTVTEVLAKTGGENRRMVQKALDRAVKRKRLRKVAPATYALANVPAATASKKKK